MSARILVVDDDLGMCEMLAASLAPQGFEVSFRTSGPEAVKLLRDEDFDAVVTDLHMGEMSGLDLCASVVTAEPDLPVVVITAFGSLESAVAAIRAMPSSAAARRISRLPSSVGGPSSTPGRT